MRRSTWLKTATLQLPCATLAPCAGYVTHDRVARFQRLARADGGAGASVPEASAGRQAPLSRRTVEASQILARKRTIPSTSAVRLTADQATRLAREVAAPLACLHMPASGRTSEKQISDLSLRDRRECLYQLPILWLGTPHEGGETILEAATGTIGDMLAEGAGPYSPFTAEAPTTQMDAYVQDAFGLEAASVIPGRGNVVTQFATGSGDDADSMEPADTPQTVQTDAAGRVSFTFHPVLAEQVTSPVVATLKVRPSRYGCNVVSFSVEYMDGKTPASSWYDVFPWSGVRRLEQGELDELAERFPYPSELPPLGAAAVARNEIYAQHGNSFDDPYYKERFAEIGYPATQ